MSSSNAGSTARRALALLEVVGVFVCAHLLFRTHLHFTPSGAWELRNNAYFSPGLVLIAAVIVMSRVHRVGLSELRVNVSSASCRSAVVIFGAFALLACFCAYLNVERDPSRLAGADGLLVVGASLLLLLFSAVLLRQGAFERPAPSSVGWIFAALLLFLSPLVVALVAGRELGSVALPMSHRLISGALSEELFFRGYVQARLDRDFGRPWRVAGLPVGPGMLVAALLFGAVHVVNPYDYFSGGGRLAWWHGAFAALMPYGLLKERTQGLFAPFVLHLLIDSAALAARVAAIPG